MAAPNHLGSTGKMNSEIYIMVAKKLKVYRRKSTPLPMPEEVIEWVLQKQLHTV
jgi:hypothetical protein